MTLEPPPSAPTRRLIADAWVGGGWHTALGAAGLAVDAGVRFGDDARRIAAFAALAGGGTLTLYGGRYALSTLRGDVGEREEALRRSAPFAKLSWLAGLLLSGFGMLELPASFTLWSGVWGIVGLAYCYPLLGKAWREYGMFKPFLLALCWSAITCGPPAHPDWPYFFAARSLWLAGLCLAFDYKDVEKDRSRGVRTPAGTWAPAVFWGAVLFGLVAGLAGKLLLVPPHLRWPVMTAWVVSLLMLTRIRRSRSTRDWVVWGDGMMIVYALTPLIALIFG